MITGFIAASLWQCCLWSNVCATVIVFQRLYFALRHESINNLCLKRGCVNVPRIRDGWYLSVFSANHFFSSEHRINRAVGAVVVCISILGSDYNTRCILLCLGFYDRFATENTHTREK